MRHDRDGPLEEADVTVDDLVDHLAEHQRDQQVERGEIPDRPLAERANDDQHQDVDGDSSSGREEQLTGVHAGGACTSRSDSARANVEGGHLAEITDQQPAVRDDRVIPGLAFNR